MTSIFTNKWQYLHFGVFSLYSHCCYVPFSSAPVVVCISLWIQHTHRQYGMFTLTPCFCKMFGSNSFQRQHFQRITITTQRNAIAPSSYAQRCIASNARYHQCGNGNQCQTNLLLFVQRFVCMRLVKMKKQKKCENITKMHT